MAKALGDLVKGLREDRGWTQADLAREARISLRSTGRIEGASGPLKIRPDTLVRAANALGRAPEELLKLAGIKLKGAKLDRVVRQHIDLGPPLAYGERKTAAGLLEEAYRRMQERGGPALLCLSISSDRSIENRETFPILRKLIEAGLFIAVTSPYPSGAEADARFSPLPNLNAFYNAVFARVRGAAGQLKSMAPTGRKNQIAVMRLAGSQADEGQGFHLAPPIMGMVDRRPCMFYFPEVEAKGLPPDVIIAAYMRFGGGRADHWLVSYPSTGDIYEQERASNAMENWMDYFHGVVAQWRREKGWVQESTSNPFWVRYEDPAWDVGTAEQRLDEPPR